MWTWWLAAVVLVGAVAAVVVRSVAARLLERVVAGARAAVTDAVGGRAEVVVDGTPLTTLLRLRRREPPDAVLTVRDATLPNGLPVRRAVCTARAGEPTAELVAHVSVTALQEVLRDRAAWAAAVSVRADGDRLRLRVGPASVAVEPRAEHGRVVVRVPVAAGPLGDRVDATLSELVPAPPAGVQVEQVTVGGDEVVVRASLEVAVLVAAAQR